jgi:crotonobetainyl-CoA:carnitine CoA-transferase CaiB-like acyl-CoA transferase
VSKVLEGIRVIEVARYAFVPSAAAALADWGADVIKVELPESGDITRGLSAFGVPYDAGGVSYLWEIYNRGKRSIGVDLHDPDGRALLDPLIAQADVFLTNFLPSARQRFRIDVDDIRSVNPGIIYGRGSALGPRGPEANRGGYDSGAYWARTGASTATELVTGEADAPARIPGPSFGDVQAGMHLAGGIAAALYHRERTGNALVVDVSLLAAGMWAMQTSLVGVSSMGAAELPRMDRLRSSNPIAGVSYRTADGRYVSLGMVESVRFWDAFCKVVDRPGVLDDPRFETAAGRSEHAEACIRVLDGIFAERTLDEWAALLSRQSGQWHVDQLITDILEDSQALANRYIQEVKYESGATLPMVVPPVQFDESSPALRHAPGLGVDTDEILLAHGYTWDHLIALKIRGVLE